MKRYVFITLAAAIFATTLHGLAQQTPAERPFTPVTDEMLWKPNPADWRSWRRTLDSHGFSPLEQVNRNNVNQLRMVWTRTMGQGNQDEPPSDPRSNLP